MDLRTKFPWLPGEHLELGMYDEALKAGKTFGEWLEDLKHLKSGSPYAGLTQIEVLLAKRRISAAGGKIYSTAFDEIMQHFGLNVMGAASSKLSKAFDYSDSSVLMGEYISQVVASSLIRTSLVSELVSTIERTNASDFRRIFLEDTGDNLELAEVSKDQELPELIIHWGDRSMRLHKYGRYLTANFDDVENVTFNALNIALNKIGMQIGVAETSEAIRIAVLGDGNDNAATTISPDVSGTLDSGEVIAISTALENPYTATHVIGQKAQMQKYFEAVVGINNPATTLKDVSLNLPKPIDWNKATANTGLQSDYLLIQDSRYHLGGVATMAVMVESERLVRKQIKGTGIWFRSAFYKLDTAAGKVMNVTT
jgi:hypothetical protein